ncbi:MAG: hypothetical protein ACYTGP_03320 [Planctomycetota bacterium]
MDFVDEPVDARDVPPYLDGFRTVFNAFPAVPLTCLWDGVVSQFRAYRVDELRALAAQVDDGRYEWKTGTAPIRTLSARVTYLIGIPR